MSNANIRNIKIGDPITYSMYSDAHSYTVTKVMPSHVMAVRNKEHIDPDWKPNIEPGGFAGHCTNNQDQKWIIETPSAEDGEKYSERFTVDRKTGNLKSKGSKRFDIYEGARPHYDYNF